MRKEIIIEMEELTLFSMSKIKIISPNETVKERNKQRRGGTS